MDNPLDLTGKTILVTGASAGIGRCTAVLLSRLGARVVLSGRDVGRLRQTAGEMDGEGHHVAALDLANPNEIAAWIAELAQVVGPLSGIAHCAGVAATMPLRFLSLKQLDDVMRVNFYSAVLLTKEFARKRIHERNASLVFVASIAGMRGKRARSIYGASKGALIAFAKSAAIELANEGIRVNCVAPSYVHTDMYERIGDLMTPEQLQDCVERTQPLGLGTPLDVANAIAFLLADTGKWITGSVLAVDGGYTAQ
ncbi:MAG TPA: SDR family oxidoreductase [Bryobacteraceae bacterium]|jgi:NAD(P)-dependent dehydrogenase (short-subunit alcohol dehydrogenase family)